MLGINRNQEFVSHQSPSDVSYIYVLICVNFMGRQLSVSKGHLASSATQSGKFERSSLRNG